MHALEEAARELRDMAFQFEPGEQRSKLRGLQVGAESERVAIAGIVAEGIENAVRGCVDHGGGCC
jgi:hypothetical protein